VYKRQKYIDINQNIFYPWTMSPKAAKKVY